MKCEKCGKTIDHVMVGLFNYDGSDSDVEHYIEEAEEDAVVFETDKDWTGYELSEEEMLETIKCPHCGKFPFESTELQVYDVVRVVMFKKPETDCHRLPPTARPAATWSDVNLT